MVKKDRHCYFTFDIRKLNVRKAKECGLTNVKSD